MGFQEQEGVWVVSYPFSAGPFAVNFTRKEIGGVDRNEVVNLWSECVSL